MLTTLRKLREEKGITQKQLADVISVSQQSINKYENHNIEPDISTLKLLSAYFDTSIDYLVGNTALRRKNEIVYKYDLNDGEKQIIDNFRKLNSEQKEAIGSLLQKFS